MSAGSSIISEVSVVTDIEDSANTGTTAEGISLVFICFREGGNESQWNCQVEQQGNSIACSPLGGPATVTV